MGRQVGRSRTRTISLKPATAKNGQIQRRRLSYRLNLRAFHFTGRVASRGSGRDGAGRGDPYRPVIRTDL